MRYSFNIIFAFLLLCSFGSLAQRPVHLNLSRYPVTYQNLHAQSKDFYQNYQGLSPFKIRQTEIVQYQSLSEKRNTGEQPGTPAWFEGIRVLYGLSAENKIVLYYVPVYVTSNSTNSGMVDFTFPSSTYDLDSVILHTNLPVYYAYNDRLFDVRKSSLDSSEAHENSARYKQYVETFIQYPEEKVSGSFFPFEVIDSLVADNKTTGFASTVLYFTSVAEKDNNGRYQHKIVISTRSPNGSETSEPGSGPIFRTMAANFGHVCPPNCPSVTVEVR